MGERQGRIEWPVFVVRVVEEDWQSRQFFSHAVLVSADTCADFK